MTSKDETLANFQACAGIEDAGEALTILESCDWDLTEALNKFLPDPMQNDVIPMETNLPHNSFFTASRIPAQLNTPEIVEINDSPVETAAIDLSVASTSFLPTPSHPCSEVPSPFNINLQVMSGYILTNTIPFEIGPKMTVLDLRVAIQKRVGVAPIMQVLAGFQRKVEPHTVITADLFNKSKTLTLQLENELIGVVPETDEASGSFDKIFFRSGQNNGSFNTDYHLLIHIEHTKQDVNLIYPPHKLVTDVKYDIYHISNVPVRSQQWTGWPALATNHMQLRQTGITKQHHFTVSRIPEPPGAVPLVDLDGDDSPPDEFEDASDILPDDYIETIDISSPGIPKPLIVPNVCDEQTGVTSFIEEFSKRYGEIVPLFYAGTLENAVKDALMVPAKSRRLLAIYLHEDNSVLCNVFCSQALCQPSVVEFLSGNFIIWGWDMTHESNKARFLNLVAHHFGVVASSTVRAIDTNKLPAILLMARTRSTIEVLSVIHGNSILDEVMTSLLHSVEMFDDQRRTDLVEEEAREEREAMKAEQDAAYQASLVADRAKDEAKKEAVREQRVERERQQSIKEQEDAVKQAVRESLESCLPPEPASDCGEEVTTLRFRTPDKKFFTRSFLLSTELQVVFNYLCVKGYPAADYKCIQSWPRRDISKLSPSSSLREHKIPLQESLTIELR